MLIVAIAQDDETGDKAFDSRTRSAMEDIYVSRSRLCVSSVCLSVSVSLCVCQFSFIKSGRFVVAVL